MLPHQTKYKDTMGFTEMSWPVAAGSQRKRPLPAPGIREGPTRVESFQPYAKHIKMKRDQLRLTS